MPLVTTPIGNHGICTSLVVSSAELAVDDDGLEDFGSDLLLDLLCRI
jgi:hypothetical protein